MNLVERIQAILLKPRETWATIAQELSDTASIYSGYLVYLAAIPALAGFIGLSIVGMDMFGVSYRVPIVAGLANMVVGYVLSLVMIYVLALIANALAPTFKGERNLLNALKLIAYGATAGMLGGLFNLIPALSLLSVLAALYTVYLIYAGIPVMMKTPADKALGYTAVLILCGIVAGLILGAASAMLTGSGARMAGMMGQGDSGRGHATIKIPGTDITLDGEKMEAASRRMDEAQARGDTAAASKAASEMLGAALGGAGGKPFEPDVLQGFVPDQLAGLARDSVEARSDEAMGIRFSSVNATYARDGRSIELAIQDIGAAPVLVMAMGAWSKSTVSRETAEDVEKVYRRDGVAIKEEYRKDGSHAEIAQLLPNGVMFEVRGDIDIETLRGALASLEVNTIAALKRPE
ncbi:MAG: YIP1 family protein [Rhodocyclales bacterium]|nr:YIP1 family protein [Rhodocyclales bacterium]